MLWRNALHLAAFLTAYDGKHRVAAQQHFVPRVVYGVQVIKVRVKVIVSVINACILSLFLFDDDSTSAIRAELVVGINFGAVARAPQIQNFHSYIIL